MRYKGVALKMKNLIYTICNNNYKPLLKIWVDNIVKYNKNDILLISPDDFDTDLEVLLHKVPNFDYKYSAKFLIAQYPNIRNYDNILYLDLDIVCRKSLEPIFNTIKNNSKIISGVEENNSMISCDNFHRFDKNYNDVIKESWSAFNAGTFGFNSYIVDIFNEYLEYTSKHLDKLCDQPIFNMFFNQKSLISPTLSDYVYLDGHSINSKNIDDYPLIHFLGYYGNIQNKMDRMKAYA